MDDTITVYLTRVSQYQDKRKYKVIVDGSEIGKIAQDETMKLKVCPGDHEIKLKIDWGSSNTLVFNAQTGQDIRLECGNNVGFNIRKTLLALTIVRNSYLYVKRAG
jgi:hypothetical protein